MNSQEQLLGVCKPQRCGKRWTTVTINKIVDDRIYLHVSIIMGSKDTLCGRDIDVKVLAGSRQESLNALKVPDADVPLPSTRLKSRTGIANYVFGNPNRHKLKKVIVTIEDVSEVFDISDLSL